MQVIPTSLISMPIPNGKNRPSKKRQTKKRLIFEEISIRHCILQ